jgi:hypothetical protein
MLSSSRPAAAAAAYPLAAHAWPCLSVPVWTLLLPPPAAATAHGSARLPPPLLPLLLLHSLFLLPLRVLVG